MNLEIERKFLIQLPDTDAIAARNGCLTRRIVQTYLREREKSVERRIREVTEIKIGGECGKVAYFYTEKRHRSSIVRLEDEREITREEYTALMTERYSGLTKTRYAFPFAGHVIEIDVYPYEFGGRELVGRAVMEVELKDEREEIIFPPEIEIIRELTGTKEFSNKALAKKFI